MAVQTKYKMWAGGVRGGSDLSMSKIVHRAHGKARDIAPEQTPCRRGPLTGHEPRDPFRRECVFLEDSKPLN